MYKKEIISMSSGYNDVIANYDTIVYNIVKDKFITMQKRLYINFRTRRN